VFASLAEIKIQLLTAVLKHPSVFRPAEIPGANIQSASSQAALERRP
jgi:hypothetical protein